MQFKNMPYTRPDMAAAIQQLDALAAQAQNASSQSALLQTVGRYWELSDEVDSMQTLAMIRHTVDTRDEFYAAENDYFDEQGPVYQDKALAFYRAVLASPHKEGLAARHGQILLDKMTLAVKASHQRLVPLQQQENALDTAYQKLYASAKIPFQGGEYTVAQLGPFQQSTHRPTRRAAFEAAAGFFDQHREELDDIYDKMVQNRTQQAKLLGYASFTPLGDIRMGRLGYGRPEIEALRKAVEEDIVPIATQLKQKQAARLGLAWEDFYLWDGALSFPDGNPTPKGSAEELLAAGQAMYRGLSPETARFIDSMMDAGLFDVLATPGKAPGGYCTYIPKYKAPFIFSNFNGTAGDVDVLTHEAGHAFAAWLAAEEGLPPELRSPGLESCEIHSMSMEFLTGDYHKLFFREDTGKYELTHLEDTLFFLPYGCQVDEFQQRVYDELGLTPAQRNELWLELCARYTPWQRYGQLPMYSRGAGWQRQLHIYGSPFYYIDYVLAQTVALEFYLARLANPADAWQRYLALTRKAGTETYPGLVAAAGFAPPYQPGALAAVGQKVLRQLLPLPLMGCL